MLYKTITDSMYPDPPEENPVCHCNKCNGDIYKDMEFIEYDGERICEFCIDEFSTDDWLELIGVSKKIAEKDMFNDMVYDRDDD